jgi:acetoin utilization deacetylase AcuC-like enzyme
MRSKNIKIFYHDKMSPKHLGDSYSKSPLKPKLFYDALKNKLPNNIITEDINPFSSDEYMLAHTESYVNSFINGKLPKYNTSGIEWSEELVESVSYTTSSLYHAIRESISNPKHICISPTSGFHHAMPSKGSQYCTFSGQVIASTKIYNDLNLSGAYIDLDAHYGNSIEDSRKFVSSLDKSIPKGCNINVEEFMSGDKYIEELEQKLQILENKILSNEIHYAVFCHGADSHIDDDLKDGICTTEQWLKCSEIFYSWIRNIDEKLGKPFPVTICLFGGYRADDYNSVINLHVSDIEICFNQLCCI